MRIISVVILLAAWIPFSQARELMIQRPATGRESDLKQMQIQFAAAYRFVTGIAHDSDDKEGCTLNVRFTDLKGRHAGYILKNQPVCQEVIELDQSTFGNWKAQVVFAHEVTHLLRQQANNEEELWLDEGLAKFMEVHFTGLWPDQLQRRLQALHEFHLSGDPKDYEGNTEGYVTSYFFVKYLYQRFGQNKLIAKLIRGRKTGWDNVETALAELRTEGAINVPARWFNRKSLWEHFSVALAANTPAIAAYALFFIDPRYQPMATPGPLLTNESSSQKSWSITYHGPILPAPAGSFLICFRAEKLIAAQYANQPLDENCGDRVLQADLNFD